jgi:hypothetical protein
MRNTTDFIQLDYPTYDLESELNSLLKSGAISWNISNGQICINGVEDDPDNQSIGCGSLYYDWDNSYYDDTDNLVIPKNNIVYNEDDFIVLNSNFRGTLFEDVHNMLKEKHKIGRMRVMKSKMKTCLTWHNDSSTRIHYPIKTQEGCLMIIEDQAFHMPVNTWWHTDTTKKHTALNGSTIDRIHLVTCMIDEYNE